MSSAETIREEFSRRFGAQPRLFRAPGRINIIGEHTDYNEGWVLPCALDLYTWAAVGPRRDDHLHIHFADTGSSHMLDLSGIVPGEPGRPVEYVRGVVRVLQSEGCRLTGCNILLGGNIPLGGGLSSSASLELVLAYALLDRAGIAMDRGRMAQLCRRAEAEFVGVQCGIMDQYAVALGAAGQAMMLDCRSLAFERIPLPREVSFLVVHSGVSHRLPTGGYNARRRECLESVDRLGKAIPGLRSLRDLDDQTLRTNRPLLDDLLYRRSRHVVTENRRVVEARRALATDDMPRLGALMNESHASLRDDYEVSCPELDRLVEIARGKEGVLGSRMMGGGFGGCTITLVERQRSGSVAAAISRDYGAFLERAPWVHEVGPAGPVAILEE